MFENLLNLIKENAGDSIINNPAIPDERNDEAISYASGSIVDTLKNAVANGNIQDVLSMFTGGNATASPIAQNMQGNFIQTLMEKFGLNQGQAGNISNSLLPAILNKFVHKTNDPNDNSFDFQDILQNISGGQGNKGFDLQDIISKFKGNKGEGGVMDNIKGLFN